MLRKVHLHGSAAELYGDCFELDVDTLGEAVQAIACQIPGFRRFLADNDFHCVRGPSLDDGLALSNDTITFRLGKADLHIMPVVYGAGGKGNAIGKIVAGVLLAGIAFFAAPALGAAIPGLGGLTFGNVVTAGIGLAAAGVSQLMSATPSGKDEPKDESYGFGNSLSPAEQGAVVPVWYGHCFVTPRIISAGIEASDIAIG